MRIVRLFRVAAVLSTTWMLRSALAQTGASPGTPAAPAPAPSASASEPPPSDDPDAKGKFNAGAQARFPSGPNNEGKFGSFNWIAVDGKGRYNVTDFLNTQLNAPFAVKKPDMPAPLPEASVIGGFTGRAELGIGKTLGLGATLGFMRDGAFLLSEKDYPYFHGPFRFGTAVGPYLRLDMFGLQVTLLPSVVWQAGTGTAGQLPLTAVLKLGSLLELAADAGVFTGPQLKLGAADGGRIYAGGSVTLKIGPIVLHAGAGVASLLTDPMGVYPPIKGSIYYDVNVKYAK